MHFKIERISKANVICQWIYIEYFLNDNVVQCERNPFIFFYFPLLLQNRSQNVVRYHLKTHAQTKTAKYAKGIRSFHVYHFEFELYRFRWASSWSSFMAKECFFSTEKKSMSTNQSYLKYTERKGKREIEKKQSVNKMPACIQHGW